ASQLARRSEKARLAGDPERAYTLALEARARDSGAPATRTAIDEAAWALYERERRAIRARAAAGDTTGAADRLLALDRLRGRFGADGVPPPRDESFVAEEERIRRAGAALDYDLGRTSLAEHRPKEAWYRFRSARDLIPGYRDVSRQLDRTWSLSVTRVAILPFNQESGLQDWSLAMAHDLHDRIAGQLGAPRFVFTQLIAPGEIEARLPVARLGRLERADAIELGRALGAQRVVWGQIANLRSDT